MIQNVGKYGAEIVNMCSGNNVTGFCSAILCNSREFLEQLNHCGLLGTVQLIAQC